jgi:phage/plasmid primase-like uncharacterized protein
MRKANRNGPISSKEIHPMTVYVVNDKSSSTSTNQKTLTDLVSEMRDHGHDIIDIPYFDKHYRHRMIDGKRGDLSGWVIASYISPTKIAATYGDWKTGIQVNWFSNQKEFSETDRAELQDRIEKHHAEQDEAAAAQEKTAVLFFGNCKEEASSHGYIESKHIQPYLAKTSGRELIIPMFDVGNDEFKSYQRIWVNEHGEVEKRFRGKSGGRACIIRGDENQHPIICEGYATACTIHEATGATVYAAMSTSNVPKVAEILHAKGETAILCPDIYDASKQHPTGAGVAAAVQAQTGKGWLILKPPIGLDEAEANSDYNDIGVNRTREYLAEKIGEWISVNEANRIQEPPKAELTHSPEIHIIDDVDYESPETAQDSWIEDKSGQEGIIPKEGLGMLFGASGSGKSFIAADFGLSIASGKPWHDYDAKQGNVLYVLGEGRVGFLNRVRSWLKFHEIPGAAIRKSFRVTKTRVAMNDPHSIALLRQDLVNLDYHPDIMFIDTLAANMEGDENSTMDAQRFITNLAHLMRDHQIKNVCLIHHTGKGDQYSARGSSVFRASSDYAIRIDTKKDMATGRIIERDIMPEKIKDGKEWEPIYFDLLDNDLGIRNNWFGKDVRLIVPVVQVIDKPDHVELPEIDPDQEEERKAITGKRLLIEIVTSVMDAQGVEPDGRKEYSATLRTLITTEYQNRNGGVGKAADITKMLDRANLLTVFKNSKWLNHPVRTTPTKTVVPE